MCRHFYPHFSCVYKNSQVKLVKPHRAKKIVSTRQLRECSQGLQTMIVFAATYKFGTNLNLLHDLHTYSIYVTNICLQFDYNMEHRWWSINWPWQNWSEFRMNQKCWGDTIWWWGPTYLEQTTWWMWTQSIANKPSCWSFYIISCNPLVNNNT